MIFFQKSKFKIVLLMKSMQTDTEPLFMYFFNV